MDMKVRSQMRNFVMQRLRMQGDLAPLDDEDPLFTSGRLDSLDAVEIIMSVEADYGINFSELNFAQVGHGIGYYTHRDKPTPSVTTGK